MSNVVTLIKVYVATLVSFVVLDATWLLLVAAPMFKRDVGFLLRDQPDLAAAGVFYLIYAVGLVILAVAPAIARGRAAAALWGGAIVGLTAYATFDLTALAILKGWTVRLAVIDMTWGTTASALAAYCGAILARGRATDASS